MMTFFFSVFHQEVVGVQLQQEIYFFNHLLPFLLFFFVTVACCSLLISYFCLISISLLFTLLLSTPSVCPIPPLFHSLFCLAPVPRRYSPISYK